jgi:hypothetical protein
MHRLRKSLIALMVASLVEFGMVLPGKTAERKTELTVTYKATRLSVEARGVSLRRVLEEIGKKLGFAVVDYGGSDRLLTFSMQEATAEEALGELLRGENYAFVYGGERRSIEKIILLSTSTNIQPPGATQQRAENRAESIAQSQTGLTYYPPLTSPVQEQMRPGKADPQVKVEDIMRTHALSGLIEPMGSPSGTANAQSLGIPAGNKFTGNTPTPPRQDLPETLAMTTRLAQQNLKALVDGLATASNSLFQSLPQGKR